MKKNTIYGHLSCSIFLLCAVLSFTAATAQGQRYHRVQVSLDKSDLISLRDKGLDVDHLHYKDGIMTAEVSDNDLQLIKSSGFKTKVLIRNLSKRIHRRNRRIDRKTAREGGIDIGTLTVPTPSNFSLGSMGGFHTFDEIKSNLDRMAQLYPNLISVKTSIGTSVEGRPIYLVRISDNPGVDEGETEVLYNALHHAREAITASQTLFFMWHLLENYSTDSEIKTLVDNTDIYFVPCVNPDGYVYNQTTDPNGGGYWRKNRKRHSSGVGTDLNRNYGYEWGYDNSGSSPNPGSDTYRGPSAFSEPETKAMRDLCNQHEFVAVLNYHSFSNLLIYPYGFRRNYTTPDQNIFSAMSTYMTEENNYTPGTPNQTVGYVGNGGSDDWMYGEQGSKPKSFSMTPEVGSYSDGFWPASSRIIPLCNDTYPMNIKLLRMVGKYAKITPVNPGSITTTTGSISYGLQRFSIRDASWTVSLSSSSSYVTDTGSPKQYSNLDFRESVNGQISFTLSSSTPQGTQIPFTLTVNNGEWTATAEVTLTYNGDGGGGGSCGTPGSLTESDVTSSAARLSWGSVVGAQSYDVDYKKRNSNQWSSVVSGGNATSASLSGLDPETGYDWRVRANCGSDGNSSYSSSSFTTLPGGGGGCQSPEDKEENGSIGSAPSISLGANIKGLINPVRDLDYYRFTLSGRSSVRIDLTNLAEDYDMRLLNQNGSTLATSQFGGTKDEEISRTLDAGDYYIRIYGYGGAHSAEQCYSLSLSSGNLTLGNARELVPEELETSTEGLRLYPNPVEDVLYIDPVGLKEDAVKVQIMDMNGMKVFTSSMSVSKGGLDVSHLSSGAYFIKLISGGEVKVQRFVKK